jgi:predicted Na+-dependent transporter
LRWLDKLANVFVLILLVEMMVTAGLGVSLWDLIAVARNLPPLICAGLANYLFVPAISISLLQLFNHSFGQQKLPPEAIDETTSA